MFSTLFFRSLLFKNMYSAKSSLAIKDWHHQVANTVRTRKLWNRKSILRQKLSLFDVVKKQIDLPTTYLITYSGKWVYLHCTIAVSHVHWTIKAKILLPIPQYSGSHCRKRKEYETCNHFLLPLPLTFFFLQFLLVVEILFSLSAEVQ